MKKTKFLLGALSLTALTPALPMVMTSCNKKSEDNSFSPTINKDGNITDVSVSKTELNRAFSVTCTCADGYEVDSSKTLVQVGNNTLTLDTDYIVYKDVIIVASAAVTNKSVKVIVATKPVAMCFSVSLYPNEGTFTSSKTSIIVNEVKKGTLLKNINGYEEPKKTDTDEEFDYWVDANGNKYTGDSPITKNIMLGARYKENAHETSGSLKNDNWATVAKMCADPITFASAYLEYKGNDEQGAIDAIKAQIRIDAIISKEKKETKVLSKKMKLSSGSVSSEVYVRLIDVGYDKAARSSKVTFTWEFADIIDIAMYDHSASSDWYSVNEAGEVQHSCILRENCNKILIQALPTAVQNAIVPVNKITLKEGKVGEAAEPIISEESLFPLAYQELGLGLAGQQGSNRVIKSFTDPVPEGGITTYEHYRALDGKQRYPYSHKYYLGFDGTKSYGSEEDKPIIQYPMWMRSPTGTQLIWSYNPDNNLINQTYSNLGLGVAPAFCF